MFYNEKSEFNKMCGEIWDKSEAGKLANQWYCLGVATTLHELRTYFDNHNPNHDNQYSLVVKVLDELGEDDDIKEFYNRLNNESNKKERNKFWEEY